MMYGVVVCSRCERARAVNLSQKTSTCECGSRIDVKRSKVYYESGSQRDVAEAVRRLSTRIADAPASGLGDRVEASGPRGDLSTTLRESMKDKVKSKQQLRTILAALGVEDADKTIARLLEEGVLYEPQKNHFRLV